MNTVFLIIIVFGLVAQNIAKKEFSKRVNSGTMTFNAGCVAATLVFFAATSGGNLVFSSETLLYALAFAAVYTICTITTLAAIKTGPLSLTALISSYSLIIPTVYGMTALGEPVTKRVITGIVLLMVSLVFVNLEKRGEEKKITAKWLIYVTISFLINGMCSVVQRLHQISSGGLYKNEFMLIALTISLVVLMLIALISEYGQFKNTLKKGFVWYTASGISNGLVNLFVMVLALKMSASVMFPVISGGSIVLTVLIAWLCYKEKLSKNQLIGVALGVMSIILLNI